MNNREQFEKWAKNIFCGYDFTWHEDAQCYSNDEIDTGWMAWQEAYRQGQVDALERAAEAIRPELCGCSMVISRIAQELKNATC